MFKYFDKDCDGVVSYQDFVLSIGFEIHPCETLYFRQEKTDAMQAKDSACDVFGCWASVAGRTLYCMPHLKQNQQKILRLYNNIHDKVTRDDPENWKRLLTVMVRNALPEDRTLIKIDSLERVFAKFHVKLREK